MEYRHVDVCSLRGRDDVDWAAYCSGGGFAGLVQAKAICNCGL